MNKIWNYLQKLGDTSNPNSSKSFALLVSTITGGIIALVICFILIYDTLQNGYVKTDLTQLGIFLLCVGGYIAGSGVTKALTEKYYAGGEGQKSEEKEGETENP